MTTAHPLLRLLVEQPQLLGEHVAAYASLAATEGTLAVAGVRRRMALQLLALACGAVSIGLVGVAVMLWAVLPINSLRPGAGWVLMMVPAVPAGAALWLYRATRQPRGYDPFAALKEQGVADLALLRELHRTSSGER